MPMYLRSCDVIELVVLCLMGQGGQNMIFLTVVACEIGRNSYFAGTDQRTGSGVWWELWVICCTNSDPLEI